MAKPKQRAKPRPKTKTKAKKPTDELFLRSSTRLIAPKKSFHNDIMGTIRLAMSVP